MNDKFGMSALNRSTAIRLKASSAFKLWVTNLTRVVSRFGTTLDQLFDIHAVKQAQTVVTNAEHEFLNARKRSVGLKKELGEKHILLKDARKELDRCSREDSNYLTFVSKEHTLLIEEQRLRKMHDLSEQTERDLFTEYSNAVRVSHEKERERAQKTKYLSIIGSVSGTIIGFLGSSLITYYRLRQIREIVSPEAITTCLQNLQNDIAEQQSVYKEQTNKIIKDINDHVNKSKEIENALNNDDKVQSNTCDVTQERGTSHSSKKTILKEAEKVEQTMHLDDSIIQLQRQLSQCVADLIKIKHLETSNTQVDIAFNDKQDHFIAERNSTQQTAYDYKLSFRENAQLGISVASVGLLLYLIFNSGSN